MLWMLFGAFVVLVLIGMPVAFAIGLSTFIAILLYSDIPSLVVTQRFFTTLDSFTLIAIPLFMLAGELMTRSGMMDRIVTFASTLVGHIRGGFAQVNILASVMFAGVSGSAAADVSATGSVMIPAMKREGYEPGFAVSLTAAGSIIGPIIPPSIMMILYGSMTGTSISDLFMAGIIPGLMLGLALMIYAYFYARKHDIRTPDSKAPRLSAVWRDFKPAVPALLMPVIVLGGIRLGVFSPTEAATAAVVYTLMFGLLTRGLKVQELPHAFSRAAALGSISLLIMAAAAGFSWILAYEMFPAQVVETLTSITSNKQVLMLLIIGMLLFIGLFLEASAALVILVPVLIGVQQAFQFDPVHFGVVVILGLVIGGITPPVGNLLFLAASIGRTTMSNVVWKVWPIASVLIVVLLLLAFIPQLVTVVPSTLK